MRLKTHIFGNSLFSKRTARIHSYVTVNNHNNHQNYNEAIEEILASQGVVAAWKKGLIVMETNKIFSFIYLTKLWEYLFNIHIH